MAPECPGYDWLPTPPPKQFYGFVHTALIRQTERCVLANAHLVTPATLLSFSLRRTKDTAVENAEEFETRMLKIPWCLFFSDLIFTALFKNVITDVKSEKKNVITIPYIEMFPLVWGIMSAIPVNLLECVHPVGRKAKIWSYFPPHFFKWLCKAC